MECGYGKPDDACSVCICDSNYVGDSCGTHAAPVLPSVQTQAKFNDTSNFQSIAYEIDFSGAKNSITSTGLLGITVTLKYPAGSYESHICSYCSVLTKGNFTFSFSFLHVLIGI